MKYLLLITVLVTGTALIVDAQVGGGVGGPNLFRLSGVSILPVRTVYELGSSAQRVAKGWFTDLDATNLLVTSQVSGDLAISNGNINIASTSKELQLNGNTWLSSSTLAFLGNSANIRSSGLIVSTSSFAFGTTTQQGIFHVATGTTNALVINSAGNVGIGLLNPSVPLHILGINSGNTLELLRLQNNSPNDLTSVKFGVYPTNGTAIVSEHIWTKQSSDAITYEIKVYNGTSLTTPIKISGVGTGQTTDITGILQATRNGNGNVFALASDQDVVMTFKDNTDATVFPRMGANGNNFFFLTDITGGGAGGFATTERLRITDMGHIGIGLSNPSSTLHISGNVNFSGSSTLISPSIGGSALLAGQCSSATTSIDTTVSSSTAAFISTPQIDPGDAFWHYSYLSASGVITTKVCAVVNATPIATQYNIKIIK